MVKQQADKCLKQFITIALIVVVLVFLSACTVTYEPIVQGEGMTYRLVNFTCRANDGYNPCFLYQTEIYEWKINHNPFNDKNYGYIKWGGSTICYCKEDKNLNEWYFTK